MSKFCQLIFSKKRWPLISCAPFFKFPYLFDKSRLNRCFTKLLHFLHSYISTYTFSFYLRVEAFRVFGLCVDDLPVYVHGVLVLEGREPREHLVHQYAQRPPVHRLPVALVQQYLRRNVLRGPTDSESTLGNYFRKAEIYHLQVAVICYHDILWLQVAVNDIFAMQILEDTHDLGTIELGLLEVEVLYCTVVGEEITSSEEFRNEIYVSIVL